MTTQEQHALRVLVAAFGPDVLNDPSDEDYPTAGQYMGRAAR